MGREGRFVGAVQEYLPASMKRSVLIEFANHIELCVGPNSSAVADPPEDKFEANKGICSLDSEELAEVTNRSPTSVEMDDREILPETL